MNWGECLLDAFRVLSCGFRPEGRGARRSCQLAFLGSLFISSLCLSSSYSHCPHSSSSSSSFTSSLSELQAVGLVHSGHSEVTCPAC